MGARPTPCSNSFCFSCVEYLQLSDLQEKSWASACTKTGVPGKLFHDLRRTAVRDMVLAGVPQSVAMSISGHWTVSVFLRYNITSGDDMREALRRTQDYRSTLPDRSNVTPITGR